jgi:hypothetical protein
LVKLTGKGEQPIVLSGVKIDFGFAFTVTDFVLVTTSHSLVAVNVI